MVDLCAAPGSWSQVLSRTINAKHNDGNDGCPPVVAIDLQPMAPLPGVAQVQGDITSKPTIDDALSRLPPQGADAVLSDGAPDVTGLHDLDEYIQSQLVLSALAVCARVLNPGGTFVAKVFRGRDIRLLYTQLRILFPEVYCAKPRASRNSSVEAYLVCRNFSPPPSPSIEHLQYELERISLAHADTEAHGPPASSESSSELVQFIACGDLSGLDSDMSYSLETDLTDEMSTFAPGRNDMPQAKDGVDQPNAHTPLIPVQPPLQPPYKHAIQLRRQGTDTG